MSKQKNARSTGAANGKQKPTVRQKDSIKKRVSPSTTAPAPTRKSENPKSVPPHKGKPIKKSRQDSKPKGMPRKAPAKGKPFRVTGVSPGEVAALILTDLTRNHSDICNFLPEVALVRQGEIFLAYVAIEEKCRQITDVSARHVWVRAQALASLKKVQDPAYDRWPDTLKKWRAAEHRCKRTNQRMTAWINRKKAGGKIVPYDWEIARMVQFIRHVVGVTPPMDEILQGAHYGPGSTVGVSGQAVHYVKKADSLDCTADAVELASESLVYDKAMWVLLGHDPVYAYLDPARRGMIRSAREAIQSQLVGHDKLMFIHKGLTSYRSIGAQPTLNGMLQLGVDPVLKRFLRDRAGVDLEDQSLNQRLALIGSRHWEDDDPWCTLDKTDASNLLALMLTNLFPPAWAELLRKLRAPAYLAPWNIGGETCTYHMYAGMGNGTTFSVESLVFAAMAYATSQLPLEEFISRHEFSVYGDDVILRRAHALRYWKLAEYMGFIISKEKSFVDGPFRESCGADYWKGEDVRPAYVKSEEPVMHELELIGTHNTLVDHPKWPLLGAAEGIRRLFQRKVSEILPTDPQGGLGFRPVGSLGYSMVRDKTGKPLLSPAWQRPRFYVYNVRAKQDKLVEIGPWTQLAVALNRGAQTWNTKGGSQWSLPLRQLVHIRLEPEHDMARKDLLTMLGNQLARLSVFKKQPWWLASRGMDAKRD